MSKDEAYVAQIQTAGQPGIQFKTIQYNPQFGANQYQPKHPTGPLPIARQWRRPRGLGGRSPKKFEVRGTAHALVSPVF